MNKLKKLLSALMVSSMILGMAACEDAPAPTGGNDGGSDSVIATTQPTGTGAGTTTDPDANAATDEEIKDLDTSTYTPSGNAGTVKYLGYYDITVDQKGKQQVAIFESEKYGGKIEWISAAFGDAYFDKLATMIASDDSPDLLTLEPQAFPYGVSKNMYEPLDDYFDIDDPLWADMKDMIESYDYKGKHYVFPHRMMAWMGLEYNRKTIADAGLTDPYDLYKNGEWTWDAWRQLMMDFCNLSDENIGYYATDATINAFVCTTGTVCIDYLPGGGVQNNLGDPNVTRAVEFLAEMGRSGLLYPTSHPHGDWVSPQVFSTVSDKILFLGLEPEWSYIAMTENVQNPAGVENDIIGTVSDFAFVPYPRDPKSDKYYQGSTCFGYMIPRGAKNIDGAVEFIYCNRLFDTDEAIQAQVKKDHVDPEKITYTAGKYEGMEKWQIIWDEKIYDLWVEMRDPEVFDFVVEDLYGFGSEMQAYIGQSIIDCTFGDESWTQRSAEVMPMVQALVDDYAV